MDYFPSFYWPNFYWPLWYWPVEPAESVTIVSGYSKPLGNLTVSYIKPKVASKNIAFILDYGSSLADATLIQMHLYKPSGKISVFKAEMYNTRYAKYNTINTSDLDESGTNRIMIYVESQAFSGYCGTLEFEVLAANG